MSLKSCMLGLHVGDSLGATLEFQRPSPTNKTHTEIIGGGKHQWRPGDPTDDTEMAMMVLESLIVNKKFDIYDLSGRFMEWLTQEPADVGRTTYNAINNLMNGISPFRSGCTGPFDQGNGSLMRCAPLAYFDVSEEVIIKQTSITHNHSLCHLADLVFIQAIREAEKGLSKNKIFENALIMSKQNKILHDHLIQIPDTKWEYLETSGFAVHALGAAFWGLLHTHSFEQALIEVVNRGDDADSAGAICGALCGAFYSEKQIPIRWLEKIKWRNRIEEMTMQHPPLG
jgi:ADP-ribosyl-[dinitrogen reductase] hydrolase